MQSTQYQQTTRPRIALLRAVFLLLVISLVATLPASAEGPSLDEIIATNIESRGGRDAMKELKTVRRHGKASLGPGVEAPFVIISKRPSSVRMEIELQGMKVIQAFDGENGWGIMPFLGHSKPSALPEDQLKQIQDQADLDGHLVDYAEKGHTVELLGVEDVDGTEAYKLKTLKKNGDVVISYLDTEYCLEFKQELRTIMQGNEVNIVMEIGDYKEVGPMLLAHSYNQTMAGAPVGQTFVFETSEPNVEVDDSIFAMPEVEEPAEETEAEEETSEKAGE